MKIYHYGEKNRLITDEKSIAKRFNDNVLTSIIKHLNMERNEFDSKHVKLSNNTVLPAVNNFRNRPSILKFKLIRNFSGFSFRPVNYEQVLTELKILGMSKTTQLEGIPTKIVKKNLDVFATFLVKDISTCIGKGEFPDKLKTADITPAFKKGDKHDKSNYQPVSIVPILSKVYEKCLYKQIENSMENILSNFQCGSRKGFNAQQCLIGMRITDIRGHFSALLTDLSKAFDCLPHDLLIAKLDAYGFKNDALYLIFNYLNNRNQRVKINSSFSSFQNIISGVLKVLCWVLCYLTFFS